jgi:hypothetical protein
MSEKNQDPDIPADLLTIIDDSSAEVRSKWQAVDKDLLMQKLVSYITRVQHNAFNEGYKRCQQKEGKS